MLEFVKKLCVYAHHIVIINTKTKAALSAAFVFIELLSLSIKDLTHFVEAN